MLKLFLQLLLIICPFANLMAQRPFITIIEVNGNGTSITLPATGTYDLTWCKVGDNYQYGDAGTNCQTRSGVSGNQTLTLLRGKYKISRGVGLKTVNFENNGSYDLLAIEQWGDIEWGSMLFAFAHCKKLANGNGYPPSVDVPNLSKVTNMKGMFLEAQSFNQPLNNWDVSKVTNMEFMFYQALSFNQPLDKWNVSKVTNMYGTFFLATSFNQPLDKWDVSNVVRMLFLFCSATSFNQPLDKWDVSNVTNMNSMFAGATSFNQPLDKWNVGNVTNMSSLFAGATSFNQPLDKWDVSNVTNMSGTFYKATSFNQPLDRWNASNVTNMSSTFYKATSFNQPLDKWSVSNVTNMREMFAGATSFNQPLGNWDVSKVVDVRGMFAGATSFDQPLDNWDVSKVTNMSEMLDNAKFSVANYDKTLISWATQTVQKDVNVGASGLMYCKSISVRQRLMVQYNWSFAGDSKSTTNCQHLYLEGSIYYDVNKNQTRETDTEVGLTGRKATIQPGNIVVESNRFGHWILSETDKPLVPGAYTVTVDVPEGWEATTPVTQKFTILAGNTDRILVSGFGLVSKLTCTKPSISVTMPFIRRCFSKQKVYIKAKNLVAAGQSLEAAYVETDLGKFLTLDSASIPYTEVTENRYRFDIGTLTPGMYKDIVLYTTVSCDAILSQTICVDARLYPVADCVLDATPTPSSPDFKYCDATAWDGSSLKVEGVCKGDSIEFTIRNVFEGGDMECYSPVRVYIDGQFALLDSVKLEAKASRTFRFAATGETYRLEAGQHPLHPGNSLPNATVELCGNRGKWTPGLVAILPQDNADPVVDIFCGLVTGSYDPNDKQGFPLGVTDSSFIRPNQAIEYLIRFQNTGTDTAFTVVIRDTLDIDLDLASVQSGASSHQYEFKMHSPRVLEWTFHNIMLPDSTTDLEGSNGFVIFKINQKPNLPEGTAITNSAGIYFDFNDPIITNTATHHINYFREVTKAIKRVLSTSPSLNAGIEIYPNPTQEHVTVKFGKPQSKAEVKVRSITGYLAGKYRVVDSDKITIELKGSSGLYLLEITKDDGTTKSFQVIKQ